ncbi:hypothetical protein PSAC2689_70191 [Paraburkholderia sacchari]
MEWSPPASTDRPAPHARILSVSHCWFGSPAAKENQIELTTIAIDLAKRVFQNHYVGPETSAIHRKVLNRAQLVPFSANRGASRWSGFASCRSTSFVDYSTNSAPYCPRPSGIDRGRRSHAIDQRSGRCIRQ